jgi:hypothetical protein
VFEALGNHAQGQGLYAGDGLITVCAIAHHAGQSGYFGEPATVILALDLDRKDHADSTIRAGCLTSDGAGAPEIPCNPSSRRAAHSRTLGSVGTAIN